ncbi:hypothetical protein CcrColossus_gp011 [Caulobacter phage CcrColossus]|uniref:Uncharacterized protein n=1 Tax=Caulobacter phage CcrColossus TaxID=1211640 RepID=K4JS24_9CAUD|nr:hypothetical protein CcrColossus_gp011 [Caulobacter phage CcrColossus]AFU87881.1 hypothetical protein CcrColossus_gp011 [Caulobacter phage CcrColossus]
MSQRYRLADQIKVANDVSKLLYAAAEALEPNNQNVTPQARAELRES